MTQPGREHTVQGERDRWTLGEDGVDVGRCEMDDVQLADRENIGGARS